MSLLEAENLRKTYDGFVAVDDVSFAVSEGEIYGLLGPNGAGKSTSVAMIAGLQIPDSGTVRLDGEEMTVANRALKSKLGLVPQELALYPDMTARENLTLFGRIYGLRGGLLAERIDEALTRIGLTDRADDYAGNYSGGMKRRLNFGMALLHRPKLLILDEPTVGVDPQSRSHLLDCVRQLVDEGMGAIYVSHYMEEVEVLCDRVTIIDHGKVLADDSLEGLLGRMKSELLLRVAEVPDELVDALSELVEVRRGDGESAATLAVANHSSGHGSALRGGLRKILDLLDTHEVELLSVETSEPSLERLFLTMTGRGLRD